MTVGIRPKHLLVMAGEGPGLVQHEEGQLVSGVIRLLEYTGSQTWGVVEVEQAGKDIMMIGGIPTGDSMRPGQSVSVSITEGPHHLFDVDTGRRLGSSEPV